MDTYFFIVFLFISVAKVRCQCDGTGPLVLSATSSPQYFTSPNYPANYPPNADCEWLVVAPSEDDRIIINVEDYDSESVTVDYMDVYDGANSSATRIVRMGVQNRKAFNAFVSNTSSLYFTFVSDYMTQYTGFNILYFTNDTANQPACGETLFVTSQEKVLMSPNLPNNYSASDACNWTFSSDTGILFQIKFLDMGACLTDHLRFYDGNSTADKQLATKCSTALTYTFTDIETSVFSGLVKWTVSNQTAKYYGFMLIYRTNVVTTTTTDPPTTTPAPTTTVVPDIFDNCSSSGVYINASIAPNFDYIYSPDYNSGSYPSKKYCRWYISAPENYSVEAYFDNSTFALEYNSYCSYDYIVFYDGNTTSALMNKFCGFQRPTTVYRSSSTDMLIIFSSDYALQYSGFKIRIRAVDNTYPGCKADFTAYSVTYNKEAAYIANGDTYINTISTPNYGLSVYTKNLELYWLFTNSNNTLYQMVLELVRIDIERSYGCRYDRLILYDGPCTSDPIKDKVCGYWAKSWYLDGPEYLLHFRSDGYINRYGFELKYYAESTTVTAPPTTTTTTDGPPVQVVIDTIKDMMTNYTVDVLPSKNLSQAINVKIDFYLVGINDLDEVEQKMTSTGQFMVTWQDSSLSWDPSKRQRVVQVLLPQDDLWKPDIALMNGFTKIEAMGASFMFIVVDYNGSCVWNPYQIMESVCKVDMTYYPYDRQTCILNFGTWSSDDSEVQTDIGPLGLQIHPNFQENSEWRLKGTETKQEDKNNHKTVKFFLTLERNPSFVTYYMTIPVVMLAYMNVFTFVIPSGSGEKSGYCITIFLSFVVLLIINSGSLPDNSDSISLYASYVLTMTLVSGAALIICTLQIRATTFSERRYPIPKCLISIIKSIKLLRSKTICRKKSAVTKVKDQEHKKEEKKTERLEQKSTTRNGSKNQVNGSSKLSSRNPSSGYVSGSASSSRTVAETFKPIKENSNVRFITPRPSNDKNEELTTQESGRVSKLTSKNDGENILQRPEKAANDMNSSDCTGTTSLTDHVVDNNPAAAVNFKMIRTSAKSVTRQTLHASSLADKPQRPISMSVQRRGRNTVLPDPNTGGLYEYGRSVAGKIPNSQRVNKSGSGRSHRSSFNMNTRPFSVSGQRPFDAQVNGMKNANNKLPVKSNALDEDNESDKSEEQSENSVSWNDLNSCLDFVFFVGFMITTTFFSLGIFLVMIVAY